MTDRLLEESDQQDLEKCGQLTPVSSPPGMLEVTRRALRSSSSEESYVSTYETSSSEPSSIIPEYMVSLETFQYIGLIPKVAKSCWKCWINSPEDSRDPGGGPNDFLSFARAHIHNAGPDVSDDQDWEEAMRGWGVAEELIERIMNPEYADLRITQSGKYWVLDTLTLRYEALKGIRMNSKRRAKAAGKPKTAVSAVSPTASQDESVQPQLPISTQWPGKRDNCIQLWNGLAATRLHGLLDEDGTIDALENSCLSHRRISVGKIPAITSLRIEMSPVNILHGPNRGLIKR